MGRMIMIFKAFFGTAAVALGLGSAAQAQFMSAAEVKPILEMTQGNWVGVRVYDGQDLLYFSHLISFRCGMVDIYYGINGDTPDNRYNMEPCYRGTSAPSAMDPVNFPLFVAYPVGSVHSVTVMILFDDGDIQEVTFERAQIQMP
jgi:hypothetical protein